MEKAKYIADKEKTLYNDLNKAHKKLKEISNWYRLSDYNLNFEDKKNMKLFILQVNNIYSELSELMMTSNQWELYSELKDLITQGKFDALEDLEKARLDKRHIKD